MLYLCAFWCAFCQRMDETSFSDDEIIALLNEFFVPVRVENSQRPEIDARYNKIGWPTIVFMTPQGDPLATVNHLPPDDFGSVLVRVHTAYKENKVEIQKTISLIDPKGFQPSFGAKKRIRSSAISEISDVLMSLADSANGGYGPDHKFPHPEANEFLLYRYETTGDISCLNHVTLTLDKMRASQIYDDKDGGYFRYSSNADWSDPHCEKLLADQAGILGNCLHVFLLTERTGYQRMAEEIINFLNDKLFSASISAFYGCQDYLFRPIREGVNTKENCREMVFIIDKWIYTDANAQVISAFLSASKILDRPECKERGLQTLEFLWENCRASNGVMFHCYDDEPNTPGLLVDQVYMGIALLDAHGITGKADCLSRAVSIGDEVLGAQANREGGFYDIRHKGMAHLRFPLTLLAENGVAAGFYLRLADATGNRKYRQAALWALSVFTGDFAPYGVYASAYGCALGKYMSLPIGCTPLREQETVD